MPNKNELKSAENLKSLKNPMKQWDGSTTNMAPFSACLSVLLKCFDLFSGNELIIYENI